MNKDVNLIKVIDFELSSICNAVCPVCGRRDENGHLTNFVQSYWTLKEVKRVLDVEIIKNLEMFSICGNYGDAMANIDIVKIVKWIRSINNECVIYLRTNGSIGSKKQYEELSKLKVVIVFGIDGIGEKNRLHRSNTNWKKINENLLAFTNISESWQTEIQFLLWNETIDQLIPLIDYLENINFNCLYLREPSIRDEYTEVFDIKERSTHFLSKLKTPDFIIETKWNKNKLIDLRNKIILTDINILEFKKSDFKVKQKKDIILKEYQYNKFEFSDLQKKEMCCKAQTCYSKHGYESNNLLENKYNIFISHDKYIMPCCLISLFIKDSIYHSTGLENNYQKEILNKIVEIGMEKFSLKDKTLKEIFESGVLHDFVYNNLEKGISYGQCKLNCGIKK